MLDSNRPLDELTGADHRAVRTALDTIAEVLHRSLSPPDSEGLSA